jgi:hypothetical protein
MSRSNPNLPQILTAATLLGTTLASPADARDPCDPYMGKPVTVEARITKVTQLRNGGRMAFAKARVGECTVEWISVAQSNWGNCALDRTIRASGLMEFDGIEVFVDAKSVTCR